MTLKKRVSMMDDVMEGSRQNVENICRPDERQVRITARSIREDETRNIYKQIKVSREVERKILQIKERRKDGGESGVTFDSLVYEAILAFIANNEQS